MSDLYIFSDIFRSMTLHTTQGHITFCRGRFVYKLQFLLFPFLHFIINQSLTFIYAYKFYFVLVHYVYIAHENIELVPVLSSVFSYVLGNNPEEMSVQQSHAALPHNFFSKFYFDVKSPKMVFKQGYLSISNQTKCPFTVVSAFFLFFQMLPFDSRLFPVSFVFWKIEHRVEHQQSNLSLI